MATITFASSINPILKNDGTVNASGTVEFYQAGTAFATPIAVYSDAALSISAGSIITLNSAGVFQCYLTTDADIKIKDSLGSLIRSVYSINPAIAASAVEANLITNGSFESVVGANSPSGWSLIDYNAGANVVDTANSVHGTNSMKFVSTGVGGGYVTSTLFPVSSVAPLIASFSIKASTATMRNIVSMQWYDSTQALVATTTLYDNSTTNPATWTEYLYNVVPPANAFWAAVKLVGGDSSSVVAGTTRFDDIRVVEDSRYKYTGTINYVAATDTNGSPTSTTLSTSLVGGETSINVASTAAMVIGGSVGVLLTTGVYEWHTVLTIPDANHYTIASGMTGAATAGTTVTSYPVVNDIYTILPALTALTIGTEYKVKVVNPNVTTTPSMKVDASAAIPIIRFNGSALLVGDMADQQTFLYDGTNMLLKNPVHVLRNEELGSPTMTTQAAGDTSTKGATTAFVSTAVTSAVSGSVPIMGTKLFGAKNMAQNSTRYMQELGNGADTTEANSLFYVNQPVRIRDLFVSQNSAPPAGQTFTFTWRKNGVDQSVTAQLTSAGLTASDTTNYFDAGPGDYLSLKCVASATTGSTIDITASSRFIDPIALTGVSMWPWNYGGQNLSTAAAGTPFRPGGIGVANTNANAVNNYYPIVHTGVRINTAFAVAMTGSTAIGQVIRSGSSVMYGSTAATADPVHYIGSSGLAAGTERNLLIPIAASSYLDYSFFGQAGNPDTENGSFSLIQQEATGRNHIMPIWLTSVAQTQNTTLYMSGHGNAGTATENEIQVLVKAGTLKNFILLNTGTGVAGQSWTATVRKNGVDTGIVVTISDTATVATNTSSTLAVLSTDLISVKLVSSATTGTRTMQFAMDHVP